MEDEAGGADDGEIVQRKVDAYIRGLKPPPAEVLEEECVYEALAQPRRRYLIYSLIPETRWTPRELATKLVAWGRDIPEEAVTDFDRDEMFVSLSHAHVPKLVQFDIIEYPDGEEDVTVTAENAMQVLAALEGWGPVSMPVKRSPRSKTTRRSDRDGRGTNLLTVSEERTRDSSRGEIKRQTEAGRS